MSGTLQEAQEITDLLTWFYPEHILHLYQREIELSRSIIDGMKTGSPRYTLRPELDGYTRLTAEPVKLEEMLADLVTADLLILGKDFELAGQNEHEIEIVQELVKRFANSPNGKEITVASTTGHFPTMGGVEGMPAKDVLKNPRLRTELEEFLAAAIDTTSPVSSGRIFFPDDKLVITKREQKPMLEEFKRWGHLAPIERARTIGTNLRQFYDHHGEKEVVYLFTTDLWSLSSFVNTNFHGELAALPKPPAIRTITQNATRVQLSQVRVEKGIYRIKHRTGVIEYVLVNRAITPADIVETNESRIILQSVDNGREEHPELSPDGARLYQLLRDLRSAPKPEPVVQPKAPKITTVPEFMRLYIKEQMPSAQQAAEWYNSLSATGNLASIVRLAQDEFVEWEQSAEYKSKYGLYEKALQAVKDLEPLLKKYTDQFGLNEACTKAKEAIKEFELARDSHERSIALQKKIKEKGIQTIPIYLYSDGVKYHVLTPFHSKDDRPTKDLEKHITEFLQKHGEITIGEATHQTAEGGIHEIVISCTKGKELYALADYAGAILKEQNKEGWHVLGYRLDLLMGPTMRRQVMQVEIPQVMPDITEQNYDSMRQNLQKRLASIKLPDMDDLKQYYKGDVLRESTAVNFLCAFAELLGGESTAGPLASRMAEKYGLTKGAAYQYLLSSVIRKNLFPDVFNIREEGEDKYLSLKPEFLAKLKE